MEQREIELIRIGFLKGIDCMENHPEDDEYDSIYFERALDQAELLVKPKLLYCGRCGKPATNDENVGDYCNKYHNGHSGMFYRGQIVHEAQ